MDTTYTYPKLRWPLDIHLHSAGDDHALVVRCPLGITERPLLLVPAVAPIISTFDGAQSFQQILDHFSPQGLDESTLTELIRLLDEHRFLANTRFFATEKEIRDSFAASPTRVAALAGLGYPNTPESLKQLVSGYLVPYHPAVLGRELVALVSPHIDYRRGGSCYGEVYPRLAESPADLYVVIGTAHQYSRNLFHLCAKDFESPLGTLSCDVPFVTQVAHRHGITRAFQDEFLHKREHSLELQLPFLKTLKPHAKIVPILVGSFHSMLAHNRYPHEWEEYTSFASALAELIGERSALGSKVCFIAGVDMAHIGRSFGDEGALSQEKMTEIAQRDSEYLAAIEAHDKKRLFDHMAEDCDARRMCGFPTLYTLLDVIDLLGWRTECCTVKYGQAVDYVADCAVTFAGMAIYRDAET
jgi:hypothetical protein